MIKTSLIACLTLVSAAALAVPAAAADQGHARHVSYSDLNLESEAGRAELQRRMARAVSSICAVEGVPDSFVLEAEQARCVAETSAGLDAKMNAAIRATRARKPVLASAGN